jgi:hypothetical protein
VLLITRQSNKYTKEVNINIFIEDSQLYKECMGSICIEKKFDR